MGGAKKKTTTKPESLPMEALRWRCIPDDLDFSSTAEVEPIVGAIGHDDAAEALRFGLMTKAKGQNIFVRGLSGTGRMTLVRRLLEEISHPFPFTKDCCFVHNFKQPDRPRLITFPPGKGRAFSKRIEKLAHFVRKALGEALQSEGIESQQTMMEQRANEKIQYLVAPFEKALKENGLQLVSVQAGSVVQTTIFPVVEGKPVPMEEFNQLFKQGKVPGEEHKRILEAYPQFEQHLADLDEQVKEIRSDLEEAMQALIEKSARWILGEVIRDIEADYPETSVRIFLNELVDDLVYNRLGTFDDEADDFTRLYRVNVVVEHQDDESFAIVAENAPTMRNLLGTIDFEFGPDNEVRANHMGIRAGALLRADGGYLILEVRDLLSEPGAWKSLIRTLREGMLEIVPPELSSGLRGPSLKPEPIKINTKVVLLGDAEIYYALDSQDPDFHQLFKVLADFNTEIPRNSEAVLHYAGILSRIAREEQLLPFDRTAVAALAEHGARIAGKNNKLTTRFSRIADIAREAAFIAGTEGTTQVSQQEVMRAVNRGKRRADLPSRKFRELVANGTLNLRTRGSEKGQINGLAVMQAGPMTYGFPSRITATIGPGTTGVINIEREAALSGAIHTKGFYILGGLLRTLLKADHPLAFDASIAFEQSYGGIDGDSASGAEICCLLSALTGLPLRQNLAMTGAIDQMGNVLAVGAVNEKIEGFYDTCSDVGLTGTQGVIIPFANVKDLMLRQEVVDACEAKRFSVFTVKTIHEALTLFCGKSAGRRNRKGEYPKNSVLGIAVKQARAYWKMAAPAGGDLTTKEAEEGME